MLERKTDDRQADYQNDVKNHGARCKMKNFTPSQRGCLCRVC